MLILLASVPLSLPHIQLQPVHLSLLTDSLSTRSPSFRWLSFPLDSCPLARPILHTIAPPGPLAIHYIHLYTFCLGLCHFSSNSPRPPQPIVKEENPEASFGEMGKLLGAKWKELADEGRKVRIDIGAHPFARSVYD